jgi:hypothetical protein
LAFDAAGNLFVTNLNRDTIREFGPTGTDLGNFASTGLDRPVGLAFVPGAGPAVIPEPASNLLLLIGSVGLWLSARGRLWRMQSRACRPSVRVDGHTVS